MLSFAAMVKLLGRRAILAGGMAMAAGADAFAQGDGDLVRVNLKTGKGLITLELNVGKAPITTLTAC